MSLFINANRQIDLFHIVNAHACIAHVTRYFSINGETLQITIRTFIEVKSAREITM